MITLPAKVVSLISKHNFANSRLEYMIEIVILGKKFNIPVTEDFVNRLDQAVDPVEPEPQPRQEHIEFPSTPEGYSLGDLERDPNDYSYEEIENL